MAKLIDLTGKQFGRLTVINRDNIVKKETYWVCRCSCGNYKSILGSSLKNQETKSCGCIRIETTIKRNTTHNKSSCREYRIFHKLKHRCFNPKCKEYRLYGGMGITICDRWKSFDNFIEDMGYSPSPKHSLDRIDNNGNYCKENCRWATQKEQMNNVSYNRKVTLNGETKNFCQWVEQLGTTDYNVRWRLKHGWNIEDAFLKPIRKKTKKSSQT